MSRDEEKDTEYIPAAEFARRKGKTEGWARYILKKAKAQGIEPPEKYRGYWRATEDQWESILKSLNIRSRRRKNSENDD